MKQKIKYMTYDEMLIEAKKINKDLDKFLKKVIVFNIVAKTW